MAFAERPDQVESSENRPAEFEPTIVRAEAVSWFTEWLSQAPVVLPEMKRLREAADYPTE